MDHNKLKILKIRAYSALVLMGFIVLSCKKDVNITPVNNIAPNRAASANYLKLTVGNYWVYAHYTQDSLGNDTPTNQYDSLYISKDSVINGRTCYYFVHSISPSISIFGAPVSWVTDSSSIPVSVLTSASSYSVHSLFTPPMLVDPAHINDTTYVFVSAPSSTTSYTNYVIPQTFTNCVVPAGTYSGCSYHVSIVFKSGAQILYDNKKVLVNYTPNIGVCYIRNAEYVNQIYSHSADVWKLERYYAQ
ncbi:MAG: hypothetical protein JST67_08270 [Bacteroidetes bacterium]|nr:hypothetical protein [Bacteroidota bacterium]